MMSLLTKNKGKIPQISKFLIFFLKKSHICFAQVPQERVLRDRGEAEPDAQVGDTAGVGAGDRAGHPGRIGLGGLLQPG